MGVPLIKSPSSTLNLGVPLIKSPSSTLNLGVPLIKSPSSTLNLGVPQNQRLVSTLLTILAHAWVHAPQALKLLPAKLWHRSCQVHSWRCWAMHCPLVSPSCQVRTDGSPLDALMSAPQSLLCLVRTASHRLPPPARVNAAPRLHTARS